MPTQLYQRSIGSSLNSYLLPHTTHLTSLTARQPLHNWHLTLCVSLPNTRSSRAKLLIIGKDSNQLERNLRQPTSNSSKQNHSIRQDSSHQKRDIRQPEKKMCLPGRDSSQLRRLFSQPGRASSQPRRYPASQKTHQPVRDKWQPARQKHQVRLSMVIRHPVFFALYIFILPPRTSELTSQPAKKLHSAKIILQSASPSVVKLHVFSQTNVGYTSITTPCDFHSIVFHRLLCSVCEASCVHRSTPALGAHGASTLTILVALPHALGIPPRELNCCTASCCL